MPNIPPLLEKESCTELKQKAFAFYSLDRGAYFIVNRSDQLKLIKKGDLKDQFFQEHGKQVPMADIDGKSKPDYPNIDPVFAPGVPWGYFKEKKTSQLYWNLFVPTKYMLGETDTKEKELPVTISAVLDNLFSGDEAMKDHFINWIAYIFNTRKKTRIGFLLRGAPGGGKGIFFDNVLSLLFGQSASTQSNENLEERYNEYINGKLLVAFNEVGGDQKERKKLQGKIKEMITDPFVQIREMRQNPYAARNYANFMFFSNEESPVNIEIDDRRFCVSRTGGNISKLEWFQDIERSNRDVGEVLRSEAGKFASYLLNYKFSEVTANRVLDSEERQNIITSTESPTKAFAHALIHKNKKFFQELLDDVKEEKGYTGEMGVIFTDNSVSMQQIESDFEKGWDAFVKRNFIPSNSVIPIYQLMGGECGKMTTNRITRAMKRHGVRSSAQKNAFGQTVRGYMSPQADE